MTTQSFAIVKVPESIYRVIRGRMEEGGYSDRIRKHFQGETCIMQGLAIQADPAPTIHGSFDGANIGVAVNDVATLLGQLPAEARLYLIKQLHNLIKPELTDEQQSNERDRLEVENERLRLIDDAIKADAADLKKMRDGTKMSRAGLISMIVYLQEELKSALDRLACFPKTAYESNRSRPGFGEYEQKDS